MKIIDDISDISFPNLKEIILFGNKIETVESIHRIWMPSLTFLNLSMLIEIKLKTKYVVCVH